MILCDKSILKEIKGGNIFVAPFKEENIQPASIDITIGNKYLIPLCEKNVYHIATDKMKYTEYVADEYALEPHSFVLATTKEIIEIGPNISAWVDGRSSIGRIGLFIQNAGWIDPGFKGTITLELYNATNQTIIIPSGMRVGQIIFAYLDKPCENPYNGKYQHQLGTIGSKIDEDFKGE